MFARFQFHKNCWCLMELVFTTCDSSRLNSIFRSRSTRYFWKQAADLTANKLLPLGSFAIFYLTRSLTSLQRESSEQAYKMKPTLLYFLFLSRDKQSKYKIKNIPKIIREIRWNSVCLRFAIHTLSTVPIPCSFFHSKQLWLLHLHRRKEWSISTYIFQPIACRMQQ